MQEDNNQNNDVSAEHIREEWKAKLAEMDARASQLSAEQRVKYNQERNNYSDEFDAVTDWTQAKWDEFSARVKQWWHGMQRDEGNS